MTSQAVESYSSQLHFVYVLQLPETAASNGKLMHLQISQMFVPFVQEGCYCKNAKKCLRQQRR